MQDRFACWKLNRKNFDKKVKSFKLLQITLKLIINIKVSKINTFYDISLVNKNFLRRISTWTRSKGYEIEKKKKLIEGSIHHKTNKRNNRLRIKTQFERKGVRRDPLLNVGQVWRICDTQRWNWKTLPVLLSRTGPLVILGKPAASGIYFCTVAFSFYARHFVHPPAIETRELIKRKFNENSREKKTIVPKENRRIV